MKLELDTSALITEERIQQLADALGWAGEEIAERLTGIVRASFSDYIDMFVGTPLPNRAEEVREKRLMYLLDHYTKEEELLEENQIATIFQLNESDARRLLRNVRSRNRADLEARIAASVVKLLESGVRQPEDRSVRVQIVSANLLDALKMAVTVNAPQLDQIIKYRGSAALYDIPPDTYTKLCNVYGATAVG